MKNSQANFKLGHYQNNRDEPPGPNPAPLVWKPSLLWAALAVVCFNLAYSFPTMPFAGLFIFGFALGLVKLTEQATVRRAFYFGLATAFFAYAPQLLFFWKIFHQAAVVLWLVLAFWVGLFAALVCGATRRWGRGRVLWLIPTLWTGLEYVRSELYYLKFSWLNLGYVLPNQAGLNLFVKLGMYGEGFLVMAIVTVLVHWRWFRQLDWKAAGLALLGLWVGVVLLAFYCAYASAARYAFRLPTITITGIQWEFPNDYIVARSLDQAFKKNPESQIFVLSEYTLDGGVPDNLKTWCRTHGRYLVIGGKDYLTNDVYYNTAFVVGTNGDVVFRQAKSVPIQFFKDGRPAPSQSVWNSPWGKIGLCICYDLSYTRVTDELIRQGAQLLIVPTMDVEEWGRAQHALHARVAPVRAAEYGVPIFRLASSGISQAVNGAGGVVAHTAFAGRGDFLTGSFILPASGALPVDRVFAPLCVAATLLVTVSLLWIRWMEIRALAALRAAVPK
jgi:apolipoprotein N-acyltransferase